MRHALLIGPAPGPAGDYAPFRGKSGERLSRLAGRDLHEWARCENLLRAWPGRAAGGKGDAAPARALRAAADAFDLGGEHLVLLAGRAVAQAFGVRAGYFEHAELRGRSCWVIPHPSGISRWWNEPGNVLLARRFLRALSLARSEKSLVHAGA